jgi:hypothetical protein
VIGNGLERRGSQRFQVLDQIRLLLRGKSQFEDGVIVVDHGQQISGAER